MQPMCVAVRPERTSWSAATILLVATVIVILTFVPASASSSLKPPVGRVGFRSAYGTYLQGNGNGRLSPTMNTDMTSWDVDVCLRGTYTIYSRSGGFLRADPAMFVNTVPQCQDWEHWFIEEHPDVPGKFHIRSSLGATLRTDEGSSTARLAWDLSKGDAWELVFISGPNVIAVGPEIPVGDVVIRSASGAFLVEDGGDVRLTSNKGLPETWRVIKHTTEGVYSFRSYYAQYLSARPAWSVTTSYNSLANEKWSVEVHRSFPGKVAIRNTRLEWYLCDDSTFSTIDTTLSSKPDDQQCAWDVIPRPSAPLLRPEVPTGGVWIQSYLLGGFLQGSSTGSVRYSTTKGTYERWQAVLYDEGLNTFRSHNGLYLSGNVDGSVLTNVFRLVDEKWPLQVHPTVPNTLAIRSTHGTYLCVEDGGSYPKLKLLTTITARCAWEIKDANLSE